MTIAPTQSNALRALRAFLLDVLPSGWEVVAGQINRVAEPQVSTFVVMTPIRMTRLRTNVDADSDCKFTAGIVGTTMAVTAVESGTIEVGATVFGVNVAAGTEVVAQVSGTAGGVGTYTVTPTQTILSRTMSAGQKRVEQGAEIIIQLDFHGATNEAGDACMTASTLLRDPYATEFFAAQDLGAVPLYADDPRQMPFINESQQYEWRWVLEAALQINVTVPVPQQYADGVTIEVISVDATYPP